jgi:hypothetical protein
MNGFNPGNYSAVSKKKSLLGPFFADISSEAQYALERD